MEQGDEPGSLRSHLTPAQRPSRPSEARATGTQGEERAEGSNRIDVPGELVPIELRCERLVLSPWTEGDAQVLLGVFRDPLLRRHLLDDELVSLDWVDDEIEAATDPSNERSVAVLERSGMLRLPEGEVGVGEAVFYRIDRERWRRHFPTIDATGA